MQHFDQRKRGKNPWKIKISNLPPNQIDWKNPQYKLSASPPPSDEEDESSSDEDDGFGPKKKPVDDDPVARKSPPSLIQLFTI